MANFVSDEYRNNVLGDATYANVQLDADTIRAMFIDNADDTVAAADGDISAILSAARIPAIASCPEVTPKTIGTVAVGVFDCTADLTFASLTGDQAEQLMLFKDAGVEANDVILCAWDTATGLPLTPNGADVTLVFHTSGIFKF